VRGCEFICECVYECVYECVCICICAFIGVIPRAQIHIKLHTHVQMYENIERVWLPPLSRCAPKNKARSREALRYLDWWLRSYLEVKLWLQERKISIDDENCLSSIVDQRSPDDGKYLYLYVPCTNREQNYRCLAKEDTERYRVECVCPYHVQRRET
jgi:hypothetical protein